MWDTLTERTHSITSPSGPGKSNSSKTLRRIVFTCCLGMFLAFATGAVIPPTTASAADPLNYSLSIIGLEADSMKPVLTTFEAASLLKADQDVPMLSIANLHQHIKDDIKLLIKIMRAEGYYGGSVTERLSRKRNHFDIELQVVPGPRYQIGDIVITYRDPAPAAQIQQQIRQNLPLAIGDPARAADVITAEAHLSRRLPNLGFPFAQDIAQDVLVDHQTRRMTVTFSLKTGNRQRFGDTRITGLQNVKDSVITRFVTWSPGDFYDDRQINDLRGRLSSTGLFAGINIKPTPQEDQTADITVALIEAEHRTIGAAAGYSTAEGISGELSWEHRNFMQEGNRLKLVARGAELEQSFSSRLEIPHFARLDQTLSFEASYRRQDTDAFFAHTLNSTVGLDRMITDHIGASAAVELEYSDITDSEGNRNFYIAALPIGGRWDNTDNLLDPQHGWRLSLIAAPTIGMDGKQFTFVKSDLRASVYYPLATDQLTLALRTRLGSITGTDRETLPATRRFYAGGGGSVRGYGFQRVGPVDAEDVPLGGRSVTEVAAELRWKFMDNISLVPFIEGGNVYDSSLPKLSGLRWGAGLGARYHTDFGPVRLDVAVPLDRRTGESRVQIYISLGQAF